MVFSPANNWTSCPPAFVVNNGSKTEEGSWLMQHDSIDIILISMTIIWNYDHLQRCMSFPFCELACRKISWWTQIHLSVAEEKTSQRKRKQDILHICKRNCKQTNWIEAFLETFISASQACCFPTFLQTLLVGPAYDKHYEAPPATFWATQGLKIMEPSMVQLQ